MSFRVYSIFTCQLVVFIKIVCLFNENTPYLQRNRCRYLVSNYTDNTLDYKALLIVLSLPITFYHRRNQLAVDIVQPPVLEGFQIGLRHPHGGVPQCLADKTDEHTAMEGKRGPGMPRGVSNI